MIAALRKEIIQNIGTSMSSYRTALAKRIIDDEIPLTGLMDILLEEHPTSTRFSWLLGDISDQHPEKSREILIGCFEILPDIRIKNFDRTIAKQAMICGHNIPEDLEGEMVDKLFDWLMDPKISVSTKNNCLFALEKICEKYPELKEELIASVNDQLDLNTKNFRTRAEKLLARLAKQ